MAASKRSVLPGFRLSLGYTVAYLSLLVLLPLAACFVKAAQLTPAQFLAAAWTERREPPTCLPSAPRSPPPA